MPSVVKSHLGEIRKLTERLNDQEATKHYLFLACSVARIGLWRHRIADGYVFWDPRMVEMFGGTQSDTDYQTFRSALHPRHRERVTRLVQEAIEKKSPHDIIFRIRRLDDGTERLIHARGQVLEGHEWMVGICLDVTDHPLQCAREHCPNRTID